MSVIHEVISTDVEKVKTHPNLAENRRDELFHGLYLRNVLNTGKMEEGCARGMSERMGWEVFSSRRGEWHSSLSECGGGGSGGGKVW